MARIRMWVALLGLVLSSASPFFAQDTLNVSTGFNHAAGSLYPIGTGDRYWILMSAPAIDFQPPYPAFVIEPRDRGRYGISANARWISWQEQACGKTPEGIFRLQRHFYLYEAGNVWVRLAVWVDDEVRLFLRPVAGGGETEIGYANQYKDATSFAYRVDRLAKGWYCLAAEWADKRSVAMGLQIEGTVSGPVSMNEQPPRRETKKSRLEPIPGRFLYPPKTVEVSQREFSIELYDRVILDDDIISIRFNDEWIIEKETLSKLRKKLTIRLDEEKNNVLTLLALSQGSIPPCTLAVLVDDGENREVRLESDLTHCRSIRFVYNPDRARGSRK
jgi:hypothetical protein